MLVYRIWCVDFTLCMNIIMGSLYRIIVWLMMSIMVYKTIFYVYYGKSLSTKRLASLLQRPFDSWFSLHVSLCLACILVRRFHYVRRTIRKTMIYDKRRSCTEDCVCSPCMRICNGWEYMNKREMV